MIDVKDLRIGNIIFAPCIIHQCYAKVMMIGREENYRNDRIAYTTIGINKNIKKDRPQFSACISDLNNINSVKLTQDTLLKCGFELLDTDGKDWAKSLDDPNDASKYAKVYAVSGLELAVSHTGEIYTIYRCEDNYYECADKKIEYLHDLQNYYYAMNKKELEVNL